jgi:hypothetical protein
MIPPDRIRQLELHGLAAFGVFHSGKQRAFERLRFVLELLHSRLLIGRSFSQCHAPALSRSRISEDRNMTADLQHLNEIWNQAWLDKDAAVIERLMADDYLYIAPNGPLTAKRSRRRFLS